MEEVFVIPIRFKSSFRQITYSWVYQIFFQYDKLAKDGWNDATVLFKPIGLVTIAVVGPGRLLGRLLVFRFSVLIYSGQLSRRVRESQGVTGDKKWDNFDYHVLN